MSVMNMQSIRFRLTVWYSFALATGLVFFGLVTWISMRQSLMHDAQDLSVTQIRSAQSFVDAELNDPKVNLTEELDEYAHALPVGSVLQIRQAETQVFFSSPARAPWRGGMDGNLKTRRIGWKGKPYLFSSDAKIIHGKRWQFASFVPLEETNRLLSKLRLFLLTLLPAVMVTAAWGGRWLSRRALKPVDDLTAAACSVSVESLSQRLFVPQTGDEIQRLAETLNALLSRLEAALQRLSQFTANAAHELRTPVSIIRTTAELATRRDRSAEDYRQALTEITSEAERMTKLLDELLLLARIDSAVVDMPKRVFELATIVSEVCCQMSNLAVMREIQVRFRSTAESTLVMGNEPAIRQLVVVLLDNAIKYSRQRGDVAVSVETHSGQVRLSITDSGPGIREEDLPHIFQRFYRSPEMQHANPSGSGLGLAVAASIAQMHGAKVQVAQLPGRGSEFSVGLDAALRVNVLQLTK